MLQRWGFVGKDLTDPKRLQPAIDALGAPEHPNGFVAGAWSGLSKTFDPALVWLTVASVAALLVARSGPVVGAWLVFLCAIAALGAIGRPGVERVYVPVYLTLAGAAMMVIGRPRGPALWALVASLSVCVMAYAPRAMESAEGNRQLFSRNAAAMKSLDGMTVVAWGWWIFYERSYPAWGQIPQSSVRIIGLNPYTYAPYSVAESEETAGRGVLSRIDSPEGALFVSTDGNYPLLMAYLQGRYNWRISVDEVASYPLFKVSLVRRAID